MRYSKKDYYFCNYLYSYAIKLVSVNATSSKTAKVNTNNSSNLAFSKDELDN
jgi:hypothetical protein